jgi:hypothetical protein
LDSFRQGDVGIALPAKAEYNPITWFSCHGYQVYGRSRRPGRDRLMTKRELVRKTIDHEETGRIPYGIYFAGSAQESHFIELAAAYLHGPVKKAVEDGLLTLEEGISIGMGNHVLRIYPPWWDWYAVPNEYSTSFDAPAYLPKVVGSGSYTNLRDKLRFISDYTDCYVLATFFGSHFEKAYFARGIENFLVDLAGDPDFAARLLNRIIEKNLVMIENILYLPGIDGVLLGSDWGSQKAMLMSPAIWRELIAPGEKKEYDLIKQASIDVWVHSCGSIEPIIPDLVQMGLDVLNPIQPECMDIFALKRQFGDRLAFWGGISTQKTLPYGTVGEVKAESAQIIGEMSRGGGYITAPSQEIQSDVPKENIIALIETAKSFA